MTKTIWHIFFDITIFGTLIISGIIMFMDYTTISVIQHMTFSAIHYVAFMLYAGFILNILLILFSKNKELYVKI